MINIVANGNSHVNGLINILSYDLVPKLHDKIMEKDFQIVIADESHYLKSAVAQRSQAVIPIIKVFFWFIIFFF